MRYRQAGNLAYKRADDGYRASSVYHASTSGELAQSLPDLPYEFPELPQRRRQLEEEKRQRRLELAEREKRLRLRALYKAVGLERAKSIAFYVSIIVAALLIMSFVMYRQAKIVEQNFAVTRLKKQIEEVGAENTQSREELLSGLDLNKVKSQAYILYGLREPAQAQRIRINLPEVDRVIRYSEDATGDIVKMAGSGKVTGDSETSVHSAKAGAAGEGKSSAESDQALKNDSIVLSVGQGPEQLSQKDNTVVFDADQVESNLKKLRLRD